MNTLGTRIGSYPIGASCPWRVGAPTALTPVARALETARTRPWMREHLAAQAAAAGQAEPTPPSGDDPEPEPTAPAPVPFDRANHCRQIGTLGGQETARRYGIAYMREIARAGFQTTCARYYGGNRAYARAALVQRRRHFRQLDAPGRMAA